ncbi:hypothetical protein AAHE18_19G120900 [Arachis hypogaea]
MLFLSSLPSKSPQTPNPNLHVIATAPSYRCNPRYHPNQPPPPGLPHRMYHSCPCLSYTIMPSATAQLVCHLSMQYCISAFNLFLSFPLNSKVEGWKLLHHLVWFPSVFLFGYPLPFHQNLFLLGLILLIHLMVQNQLSLDS